MAKSSMSLVDKMLRDRIFLLFPGLKDEVIANKIGTTRQLVQGWRAEKSRPTMKHLRLICEATYVDMDWLMLGKTSNIEAITYAYFPAFVKDGSILKYDLYREARRVSGVAVWTDEGLTDVIHAVAALFWGATQADAPDPMQSLRENDGGQPTELEYIEYCKTALVPDDVVSKVYRVVKLMRDSFVRTLYFNKTNALSIEKKESNKPQIAPNDFYEIPFYPDEIAAGRPLSIRDEPEGVVVIHRDWCPHPEKTVAVRVSRTGTSMEPTIPAGAIVSIDTTSIRPEPLLGEVVAIFKADHGIDDGVTIKRLAQTSRGWCGVPDNRSPEHKIIVIDESDRIVGKVTSVHYKL